MNTELDGKGESDLNTYESKQKSSTGSSLNQTNEDSIFTANSIFLSDHSSFDVYGAKGAPMTEMRSCNTTEINLVYGPPQGTA